MALQEFKKDPRVTKVADAMKAFGGTDENQG